MRGEESKDIERAQQDRAELRFQLQDIGRRLFSRRLVSGTSGNISVRDPGCSSRFLIKASGCSLEDARGEDFVLVDAGGRVLCGEGVPSVEMPFHRGIYEARPDVQGIVHGHSPFATAYVMLQGRLPEVTVEARLGLGHIGIVACAEPGSAELAAEVAGVFADKERRGAVLCDHGFVTVGRSLREAYYLADALEENARVAYLRLVGVRKGSAFL